MRAILESMRRVAPQSASMRYAVAALARSRPSPPDAELSGTVRNPLDRQSSLKLQPIKGMHICGTMTPAGIRYLYSTAAPQGSDSSDSLLPPDLRWWPPTQRNPVWKHILSSDPKRKKLKHPFNYVIKHKPFISRELYGENWITDIVTGAGTHLISGMSKLLAEMQLKGISFYNPPTVESFCIDEFGCLQIAEGVLLRPGTRLSSAIDTYFSACVFAKILTYAPNRKFPVRLPNEVLHLLKLMRNPWLPQLYLMVTHPSGFPVHERRSAFLNVFEVVQAQVGRVLRCKISDNLQTALWSGGKKSWSGGIKRHLLLKQWFHDPQYGKQYGPDQEMEYQRNCECHIFAHLSLLSNYGFRYSRDDQEDALQSEKGVLLPEIHKTIWKYCKEMLPALKPERHICRVGICCPIADGCFRRKCFAYDKKCREELGCLSAWKALVLRVLSTVEKSLPAENTQSNVPRKVKDYEEDMKNYWNDSSRMIAWDRYEERSYAKRQFGSVLVEFIARDYNELTVKPGDHLEIISKGSFIKTTNNEHWVNPRDDVLELVRRTDGTVDTRWFYVKNSTPAGEKLGLLPAWCVRLT